MNLYGGLLLFSGFLLYDTQRVIRLAEIYPEGRQDVVYDPINAYVQASKLYFTKFVLKYFLTLLYIDPSPYTWMY